MKKQVLFIALLTFAMAFQAIAQIIVKPSGNITKENHEVGSFTGLDVSTDFKAFITFSNKTSVQIESDDNMHQHIKVEVEGNTLVIRQKGPINVKGRETLVAHISVPSLKYIKASGDAIVKLENKLTADELRVSLSGDSKLDGELAVGEMEAEVRGDSYLTLSGTANMLDARVRGDSHLKSFDFKVGSLKLNLSGDSIAKLTINESMDVDISGDSVMKYKGSPKVEHQRVRGDSELAKED